MHDARHASTTLDDLRSDPWLRTRPRPIGTGACDADSSRRDARAAVLPPAPSGRDYVTCAGGGEPTDGPDAGRECRPSVRKKTTGFITRFSNEGDPERYSGMPDVTASNELYDRMPPKERYHVGGRRGPRTGGPDRHRVRTPGYLDPRAESARTDPPPIESANFRCTRRGNGVGVSGVRNGSNSGTPDTLRATNFGR